MEGPQDKDPESDLKRVRHTLTDLQKRLQMLLDESTRSTKPISEAEDVMLRVSQDRRRSKTNILPYRKRRTGDPKA
jgi:hypothetical protein